MPQVPTPCPRCGQPAFSNLLCSACRSENKTANKPRTGRLSKKARKRLRRKKGK